MTPRIVGLVVTLTLLAAERQDHAAHAERVLNR
jgi:hypothetical protein